MTTDYDVVTVGGGLGGAAIAKAMAERGGRVLVLEREPKFRDRVRGEGLSAWGGTEAIELGLSDAFQAAGANRGRYMIGFGADRDLIQTTPHGLPMFTFYHPAMQEALLAAAAQSGAEVRRGVSVTGVAPGSPATVRFEDNVRTETINARLVVGTDGRTSNVRRWGNFSVKRDPDRLIIAGVLLEGGDDYREDAVYFMLNPGISQAAFLAPQGNRRMRAYVGYRSDKDLKLHGVEDLPRFIAQSIACGVPAEFYENARPAGPLASFHGADNWIDHPYANGVALIGDAAAASDPCWGQGLSLTLRDARVLRDALVENDDWDRAAHAYAREHDRYYTALHTWEDWFTRFFYDCGEHAEAVRARALPLIMEDPERMPDYLNTGPDLPVNEEVRKRIFAED